MVQCLMEHYRKVGNMKIYAWKTKLALHKVCAVRDGSVEIAKYLVETCHVDLVNELDAFRMEAMRNDDDDGGGRGDDFRKGTSVELETMRNDGNDGGGRGDDFRKGTSVDLEAMLNDCDDGGGRGDFGKGTSVDLVDIQKDDDDGGGGDDNELDDEDDADESDSDDNEEDADKIDDDDDKKDTKGTPLLRACQSGNMAMIRYLESCGADINATDAGGNSVLHRSVEQLDVFRYYVETHNVNVNQPNRIGETTLHRASKSIRVRETLQYLVGTCNINKDARNVKGETCLHVASRKGCMSAVQCVFQSGCVNVNAQDKKGRTVLHRSSAGAVKLFKRTCFWFNKPDAAEASALNFAEDVDFLKMTRFWVDTAGVKINIRDKKGKTALHIAAAAATKAAAARQETAAEAASAALKVAEEEAQLRNPPASLPVHSRARRGITLDRKVVARQCNAEAAAAVATWDKQFGTVLFLVARIPAEVDDEEADNESLVVAADSPHSKRPKL